MENVGEVVGTLWGVLRFEGLVVNPRSRSLGALLPKYKCDVTVRRSSRKRSTDPR